MRILKGLSDKIIEKYYKKASLSYNYLYPHSRCVAKLAIKIAEHNNEINPDFDFIYEAAMLHDIGIFMTNAEKIGCYGKHPYLAHGYLGRKFMDDEGYPEIGLVCERHVGVGISKEDVIRNNLPMPERDMLPVSLEEKIICYADKFYSKNQPDFDSPKPIEKILRKLRKHSPDKPAVFKGFMKEFGYDYIV